MPVTKEEQGQRGAGYFLGRRDAPHREGGDELGAGLLWQACQDRCVDGAGADDVRANPAIYPTRRLLPRRARVFMDLIAEAFSGNPVLNEGGLLSVRRVRGGDPRRAPAQRTSQKQ
jgi:hypothetical protein